MPKAKNKKCRCGETPLIASVRKARIEDIPDGSFIDIPNPICGECLEKISEELWELDA